MGGISWYSDKLDMKGLAKENEDYREKNLNGK